MYTKSVVICLITKIMNSCLYIEPTGLFIKYCISLDFVIFLNSASSAAALVFYFSGVCTHTDTEGQQREARVRNILKSSKKKHNN